MAYPVIAKTDSVIEIPYPDNSVMVFDRSVALEMQTLADSTIISIPLLIICETSGQMGSHEAKARVCVILELLELALSP